MWALISELNFEEGLSQRAQISIKKEIILITFVSFGVKISLAQPFYLTHKLVEKVG